jgi:hypothetical protein
MMLEDQNIATHADIKTKNDFIIQRVRQFY